MGSDRSDGNIGEPASAPRRRPPSLVVGIGASAGGLAAFRSFFDNMPADTGMAFVLVQHLDPDHKSLLVELLRPHTAMQVVEAQDRAELVPNQIHVIPPNTTLTLEGDVLRVSMPVPPREYRRPIDTFFASLAESQEDCAVGIILSGVGSDGSLGVKAIKEYGGFTLAQAGFDETAMTGMPSSAAATGLVDQVSSVEILPAKLLEHQAYLAKVEDQKGADGAREDILESLSAITALLRKRLKHDFSGYKQNTLIRRIQRRMQVLQIEAVPAYAEHLRHEPSEGDALFRELLIGVTQFFRDEEAFEALRANVLPSLFGVEDPKIQSGSGWPVAPQVKRSILSPFCCKKSSRLNGPRQQSRFSRPILTRKPSRSRVPRDFDGWMGYPPSACNAGSLAMARISFRSILSARCASSPSTIWSGILRSHEST